MELQENMTPKTPIQEESNNKSHKHNENKYRQVFRDFVDESSANGLNKVFSSKPRLIRFIWALLCIVCYGVMIWLSFSLIVDYFDNPTSTFVDVSVEQRVVFPAVTICNLNKFRRSRLNRSLPVLKNILDSYRKNSLKFGTDQKPGRERTWDTDERKDFYLQQSIASSGIQSKNLSGSNLVDSNEVLEGLILQASTTYSKDVLVKAGHPFEHIIAKCSWMGLKCDEGYSDSKLKPRYQGEWEPGTFLLHLDSNNAVVESLTTTKAGPDFGLQLDIFIGQHEYVPELSHTAGARMVIGNQRQYPFPYSEGMDISPGRAISVALRKKKLKQHHIKMVDGNTQLQGKPQETRTYKSDFTRLQQAAMCSYNLETIKEVIIKVDRFNNNSCMRDDTKTDNIYSRDSSLDYTVQSCLDTCLVNHLKIQCNCTDAQYPSAGGNICTGKKENLCSLNVQLKYKGDIYNCKSRCPQRCSTTSFRTTKSDSQISNQYQNSLQRRLQEKARFKKFVKTKEGYMQDFLRLKIYFEELNLVRIQQHFSYPIGNLLADIGGQLGLWVGLSVITFAELGELLISIFMVFFKRD